MLICECTRCARCTQVVDVNPVERPSTTGTRIKSHGRKIGGHISGRRFGWCFGWRSLPNSRSFQSGINFVDKVQPAATFWHPRAEAEGGGQRKTFSAISSAVECYDVCIPAVYSSWVLAPFPLSFFPSPLLPLFLSSFPTQFFRTAISPLLARRLPRGGNQAARQKRNSYIPKNSFKLKIEEPRLSRECTRDTSSINVRGLEMNFH